MEITETQCPMLIAQANTHTVLYEAKFTDTRLAQIKHKTCHLQPLWTKLSTHQLHICLFCLFYINLHLTTEAQVPHKQMHVTRHGQCVS